MCLQLELSTVDGLVPPLYFVSFVHKISDLCFAHMRIHPTTCEGLLCAGPCAVWAEGAWQMGQAIMVLANTELTVS